MNKEWRAKWITDKEFSGLNPINIFHKESANPDMPNHREDLKNRHILIRKKFSYYGEIDNAYIDITADDYYKLYINGQFVGQGPAPSYHFHYYYNRHDVSKYLKPGINVISIHIYYQGLINRVWNSGDYRCGAIAELFIKNELQLCTDCTWKYTRAEEYAGTVTTGYDTQYLEDIDFRLKLNGWYNEDFDDTSWESACENPAQDYKLVIQPTPCLDVYDIKPAYIKQIEEGHFFIDFGHEITGQFKLCARGNRGEIAEVMCGEELEEGYEDRVRYNMRCNCSYYEKMILSGSEDILEHFDYKAFRYVEVKGPKDALAPESFCAVARHYPFDEEACEFNSSDALLNNIWQICKNSIKYGSQEVFVDCPSREKGQYLGDATITAKTHAYISGDLRLYKKALTDFANSTFICPGMMAVAPGSLMQEIADYSLQWPLQLLNYYYLSGDLDFLKEMYPVVQGIEEYFKKFTRKDGLLENVKEKWNLVDWPENLRDGYDFDLSRIVGDGCHNVINAFYCGAVKTINEIRNILGICFEDKLPGLQKAYIETFYRPSVKLFADSSVSDHTSLHSNIIPLYYGFVPDEAKDSVMELIRQKRLNCGVYISYFLLKGLAAIGEYELVYDLITSQDEHSWANMIREGATTCFEAWGKDQKWNTSLCHPWASAPISVLIEDIIGLTPAKPGWKEVSFTPHIPASLKLLHLKLHTANGIINIDHGNGESTISMCYR